MTVKEINLIESGFDQRFFIGSRIFLQTEIFRIICLYIINLTGRELLYVLYRVRLHGMKTWAAKLRYTAGGGAQRPGLLVKRTRV